MFHQAGMELLLVELESWTVTWHTNNTTKLAVVSQPYLAKTIVFFLAAWVYRRNDVVFTCMPIFLLPFAQECKLEGSPSCGQAIEQGTLFITLLCHSILSAPITFELYKNQKTYSSSKVHCVWYSRWLSRLGICNTRVHFTHDNAHDIKWFSSFVPVGKSTILSHTHSSLPQ